MLKRFLAIAVVVFGVALLSSNLLAESKGDISPPETAYEMNGIRLSDYLGFEKKWPLVVVTFRVDSGEQRFAYANDIAHQALLKGQTDYPDGAVFAKIGVLSVPDPAFPSSLTPMGAIRYQFMVRDMKKYAETEGWGYAIFDTEGDHFSLLGTDGYTVAQGCLACHKVVKDRGYVFSRPMRIAPFQQDPFLVHKRSVEVQGPTFVDYDVTLLPEWARKMLPIGTKRVRSIEGPLRGSIFLGSILELSPVLTKEVERTGQPVVVLSNRDDRMYGIFPTDSKAPENGLTCKSGEKRYSAFWKLELIGIGINHTCSKPQ